MNRTIGLLLGGLAIVALALVILAASRSGAPSSPGSSDFPPAPSASPTVEPSPTAIAPTTPTATPSPTATPAPTATPTPEAARTAAPGTDARLAYAEFALRLGDAAKEAQQLNADLRTAAEDLDTVAVERTAVDILDFVDSERDWLRDHPPAACYADAHDAAGEMLAAYGAVAEAALAWTGASGLDAIAALADLGVAVEDATAEAQAFARAFDAVDCRA